MAESKHKSNFAERFKDALTAAGIDNKSPTAIGEFLGVRKQTVAQWLNRGEPKPAMLFRIADKTKVEARWLALGHPPMEKQEQLKPEEMAAVKQIYRVLGPKALRIWLRDGHELVEISAPVGPDNPYGEKPRVAR